MGLSPNESWLHFRQEDCFVHALDLRTADHLHVSVRSPE